MEACADGVRIMSRRMVQPWLPPPTVPGNRPLKEEAEEMHLTPWDLRLMTIDYIQKGILLPKPPAPAAGDQLVDALASSFARALGRFYPFTGRLAAQERGDGTTTVSLRCTGEGAELVHATAPGVAVADIVTSLYTPPVVWSLYALNQVIGADATVESLPVLSAQVTELADGVFIGVSMNHAVGDGTTFWHFLNTWSEINRRGGTSDDDLNELSTPAPVLQRWFVETSPVPIPMPFTKLQHVVRRFELPAVDECFFPFSAASVKRLKARANDEMDTFYHVSVGCRGRVNGIPAGYVGNAVVGSAAKATAGEVERNGLGWTAWLLNRAVASFDEARARDFLDRWVREPKFVYLGNLLSSGGAALLTGSSPRFDVFGNDFGWGKPVAVRCGSANKLDGKATVFEGPEKGGSISLGVCLAPDALARLVADEEFMNAVNVLA
ncbi:hypothetical protein ACP70R_020631 [Stipagrostis hirtigluma subsp. patula]